MKTTTLVPSPTIVKDNPEFIAAAYQRAVTLCKDAGRHGLARGDKPPCVFHYAVARRQLVTEWLKQGAGL